MIFLCGRKNTTKIMIIEKFMHKNEKNTITLQNKKVVSFKDVNRFLIFVLKWKVKGG